MVRNGVVTNLLGWMSNSWVLVQRLKGASQEYDLEKEEIDLRRARRESECQSFLMLVNCGAFSITSSLG